MYCFGGLPATELIYVSGSYLRCACWGPPHLHCHCPHVQCPLAWPASELPGNEATFASFQTNAAWEIESWFEILTLTETKSQTTWDYTTESQLNSYLDSFEWQICGPTWFSPGSHWYSDWSCWKGWCAAWSPAQSTQSSHCMGALWGWEDIWKIQYIFIFVLLKASVIDISNQAPFFIWYDAKFSVCHQQIQT